MAMEQAAYADFSECIDKVQKKSGSQFEYPGFKHHRIVQQANFRGHVGLLDRVLGTGVYIAALAGRDDMVRQLLDKGLKLEQNDPLDTPLRASSLMGQASTI
jgi:hypothetical protein